MFPPPPSNHREPERTQWGMFETNKDSQGIEVNISKDQPHGRGKKEGGKLPYVTARDFLRGQHGFGKYGWTFDKFKLKPAKT